MSATQQLVMQAVHLRELGVPDVLRVEETVRPRPGPRQVLIEVSVIGVNFADVQMRQGTYPVPLELPVVLGGEVAGRVADVGPNVDERLRGRRVAAFVVGGYAEWAVADVDRLVLLPDGVGDDQGAASLVCGVTALGVLTDAGDLRPGETVLVQAAAGGVGAFLVQLARAMEAGTIVAAASSDAKLEAARGFGADVVVDYTDPSWADVVRAEVGTVDLALETTGGEVAAQSLSLLREPGGRMVYYGGTSGEPPAIAPFDLVFRNATLRGFALPPYLDGDPAYLQNRARRLFDLILDGAVQVPIGGRFALGDAGAAHELLEQRSAIGKLLLVP